MTRRLVEILEHESSGTPPADVDPPFLTNQVPAPAAIHIARDANITFRVTDLLNLVDLTSVQVYINLGSGVAQAYDGNLGGFQAGFTGTASPVGNGYDFVINPTAIMGDFVLVTVQVIARDTSALQNQMDVTYSFRSNDETIPILTNLNPADMELDVPEASNIMLSVQDSGEGVDPSTINIEIQEGIFGTFEPAVVNGVIVSPWAGAGSSITADGLGGYDIILVPESGSLVLDDTVFVHVVVEDLVGNELDTQYIFSTFFALQNLVEFVDVGRDGGGPFTVTIQGLTPGTYEMHVGPLSSVEDPVVYNGTPGSANTSWVTFVDIGGGFAQATNVYLPPNPVGDWSPTLVPVLGGSTLFGSHSFRYKPASFKHRTMLLRRVLPPWYKTGVRTPDAERFPQ